MIRFLTTFSKYVTALTLSVLNLLCVVGLNMCAYSALIPPQNHPSVSYFGLLFPFFLAATVAFLPIWFLLGLGGMSFGRHQRSKRSAYWGMLYSIVGMGCCAGSIRTYFPVNLPTDPPADALHIVSYNVYGLVNPDKLPVRELPIMRYLLDCKADIVCIQESGNLTKPEADSLLATVYPYRSYDKIHGMSIGLLSRHPILNTDTISYPSKSNGSVWYNILIGNDTVLVVNNHLESYKLKDADREEYKEMIQNPDTLDMRQSFGSLTSKLTAANAIRGVQADSVASFVENSGRRYIIVCGDFNDASISYTHHRLTRQLNDAYTRSGIGPGLSYNRSGMYFRIDNILCSQTFKPYAALVDNSIKDSDHYPISAWLQPIGH